MPGPSAARVTTSSIPGSPDATWRTGGAAIRVMVEAGSATRSVPSSGAACRASTSPPATTTAILTAAR